MSYIALLPHLYHNILWSLSEVHLLSLMAEIIIEASILCSLLYVVTVMARDSRRRNGMETGGVRK